MLFHLNKSDSQPLYQQLYHALKNAIHQQHLTPGQKLPSKRTLAREHGISYNTVITAYEQLVAEGYLQTIERKGYYVRDLSLIPLTAITPPTDDFPTQEQPTVTSIDFVHTTADSRLFPYKIFKKYYQDILNRQHPALLKAPPTTGLPELKHSLSHYISYSRGVHCVPEQIIIGSSTQALLQWILPHLPNIKHIGLENPGYHRHRHYLEPFGYQFYPCPIDQEGILFNETLFTSLDALFVTPNHQFPTGGLLPLERRLQLLQWAQEQPHRYIFEDDYDSELRYEGMPIPALANLNQQRIIYTGSMSRVLSPSIRLSYMVLPLELANQLRPVLSAYPATLNTLDQLVIHEFLDSGAFQQHLNRARTFYRKKRDFVIQEILKHDPQAEIIGQNAGLHLLIQPSKPYCSQHFLSSLQHEQIQLKTLADFEWASTTHEHLPFYLSYSGLSETDLQIGISRIFNILKRFP